MKRIRPSNPAPKCPDYIHSLPKRLADDLHQKPGERYSKYEAFRYLCERQAVHSSDQSRNHTDPFTVTITELSVDWAGTAIRLRPSWRSSSPWITSPSRRPRQGSPSF